MEFVNNELYNDEDLYGESPNFVSPNIICTYCTYILKYS